MDKKALTKAILVVIGFVIYGALICIAALTQNETLAYITVGPLVLLALFSVGYGAYYYFKD